MDRIPFAIYDFFGYLASGFLLVAGIDYSLRLHWILGRDYPNSEWILWILTAYVVGHINAHLASWLLERKMLKVLRYPSQNLFDIRKAPLRILSPYFAPLPHSVALSIQKQYKEMNPHGQFGEELFLYCYHLVKEKSPNSYSRVQVFLNQYGFCRNMGFALLCIVPFAIFGAYTNRSVETAAIAFLCPFLSCVLILRYLKFFRLYSVEVFLSFWSLAQDSLAASRNRPHRQQSRSRFPNLTQRSE